jgi:serine/threonine protein kinase/Leucine-rich repeat (LRR) protein
VSEEQIFLNALDLHDLVARKAYLDECCGNDANLRHQVERLLTAHFQSGDFMDVPAPEQIDVEPSCIPAVTILSEAMSAHMHSEIDAEGLEFLDPSSRPDSLGRIGHYEVLQVLGVGGFGIVLRAFDDILQRVVAVKVMAPQMAATSPARKRFLRDARTSAQVRHDNVVQVYEVGEQPLPYLVMEFIPGETLQQRLDRIGPLEVGEVLRIGRQIAEGLAAAHATDLIHRDIKPGNVLLEGGHLKVKITDFGLARAADDASMTQSGMIAGTPMYMAPEQVLGHTLDQRADLFSLGTVMYQMVSGRVPFRAPSSIAVLKRVAEDTPRNIREVTPETPQWLCDIIAKLHAKNPDERFQSAREVADVLADCEEQLKVSSKLKDYSRIPRAKPTAGNRWKWVAAAALLLPVIALTATEFAGVTHLLQGWQATIDPIKPGSDATPAAAAKQDVPAPPANEQPLPPTYTNSLGMEFVIVPMGRSWLGGGKEKPADQDEEIPADFYLGKYEVTQEEWEKVMGENPSRFSRTVLKDAVQNVSDADLKRFPVEYVSWDQCQLFAEKLNQLEKEKGWVYRLPTDVEWEYACRGGGNISDLEYEFDYYFEQPTNAAAPDQANFHFGENALNRTCKVGSYKPNRLGLCDMHGNVWEWCQDEVMDNGVSKRPTLGGGWELDSFSGRAWFRRSPHLPSHRHQSMGLRLARVPVSADSPSPAAKPPTLATSPFNDADVKRIANLPAAEQVEEVRKELMKRNPGFDGNLKPTIENGVVTELSINTDEILDISPVRALTGLVYFDCRGTYPNKGKLSDLSPLRSMTISRLDCSSTQIADLSPLADLPLTFLAVNHNPVSDLTPFKKMPLDSLGIAETKVPDLSPLQGMKIKTLGAQLLPVTDLAPLAGMPLTGLDLYHTVGVTSLEPLRGMPLENLNLQDVPVSDLSPLRGMTTLRTLLLQGNKVSDLSPLAGLKLTDLLLLDEQIVDLTPLKGLPLTRLHIYNSGVSDLRPLQGMPLVDIRLNPKNITQGLDVLREIKTLQTIGIDGTQAWPAAEFWERLNRGEFGTSRTSSVHDTWLKARALVPLDQHAAELAAKLKERLPGFEDALLRTIPGLAADRQAIVVAAWLRDHNPAFVGEVAHKIEGGVLTSLEVPSPLVQDLTPLQALPGLRSFTGRGTLGYDNQAARDAAVLRSLKTLETINDQPVAAFWKDAEARQAEFQEWLKQVATLPAEQQVAAVVAKLKERNPGLDGTATHKFDDGVVTELSFIPVAGRDIVTDLSPVRALVGLTYLNLWSCVGLEDLEPLKGLKLTRLITGSLTVNNQVRDLEPLKGMPLTELRLYHCQVQNLEPLQGIPLNTLWLFSAQLRDIEPIRGMPLTSLALDRCSQINDFTLLKGMPLTQLALGRCQFRDLELLHGMPLARLTLVGTQVQDLEPLKGMPLKELAVQKTGVTDLTPLQGMELEKIHLTPKTITQGLDILRDMQSLKTIGIDYNQSWPAAEFWERLDKGEFQEPR